MPDPWDPVKRPNLWIIGIEEETQVKAQNFI